MQGDRRFPASVLYCKLLSNNLTHQCDRGQTSLVRFPSDCNTQSSNCD